MSDMKNALASAGIKVPANKRIWLWLRDHPGKRTVEIHKATGIPIGTVSSQMAGMKDRGMVRTDGTGTYHAVGAEFELLPLPATPPWLEHRTSQPAKATAAMPDPMAFNPERFLAKLTLSELRAVHAFTVGLFGRK